MKKFLLFSFILCSTVLVICGCGSKNPVGPSSMLSLGSNASSGTTANTNTSAAGGNTNTSNSGNTGVDTTPTNTVSTQTGDTGVSSAEGSTGVSSGISGAQGGGSNTSSGGTISVVLSSANQVVFPSLNLTSGSRPTIAWTFSGISGVKMIEVLVSNPQSPNYTPAWDIYFPCSTPSSVVYGVAPGGSLVTNAPITLT